MIQTNDLPTALSNVRWIGGGSGAAKSTMSQRLIEGQNTVLYDTDLAMRDHAYRCGPENCPNLAKFKSMSMDERWVLRTPQMMFDSFHWFQGEGFDFVVEDLLAFPKNKPVIAEGFRLLPRLVAPLLQSSEHAIWLLPTPDFRRHAFDARGSTWDIASKTSDPDLALANLLARDQLFTDQLQQETSELGLHSIIIDGQQSEDQLFELIKDHLFG